MIEPCAVKAASILPGGLELETAPGYRKRSWCMVLKPKRSLFYAVFVLILSSMVSAGIGVSKAASGSVGRSEQLLPVSATPESGRKWMLYVVGYVESPLDDEVQQGLFDGLQEMGLARGRDFEAKIGYAQGEMSILNSLIDRAVSDRADLLVVLSTPALQAAIQKVKHIPVIFASVCPVQAGAGKSFEDHLPNVTGVSTMSDFREMVKTVKECIPNARRLGTLFNPGEVNSVIFKEALGAEAAAENLELISVPVSTTAELADATATLLSKPIDAICQISDNTSNAGFAAIASRTRKAGKPLFCFSGVQVKELGAAVGIDRDLPDAGKNMAAIIARIMAGEIPKGIPFKKAGRTRIVINLENARLCSLNVPASLIERADEVVGQ